MGAEALCRGASWVVGIEQSARACGVIRENWTQIASPERFEIVCGEVVKRLEQLGGDRFDRIYFDPPYHSNLYLPVLEAIATRQLLSDTGELAVEHSPQNPPPPQIQQMEIFRQKVYGNSAVTFYQENNSD